MALRWVISNDHAAIALKKQLLEALGALGIAADDLGANSPESVDYPDFAHALGTGIAQGRYDRGVLLCGTGIGVSIAANRHAGVRAALCNEVYSAKLARQHNDANVLCMGARVVGAGVAEEILRAFVATEFLGDRHARRVAKIELA